MVPKESSETDAIEAEKRKWTAYYASINSSPPLEALEFGKQFAQFIQGILPGGGRILEAGCGAGWQSLALAQSGRFQVDLLDFSSAALDAARSVFKEAGLPARFILGDAFRPGEPEYDLVFNSGVIEHYHFDQQVRLLRGMASRSRRHVVVLAPNRHCYWYWISRIHNAAAGNWPFGAEYPIIDFRQCFEAAGLRFAAQSYLGETWTEMFIRNLSGIDSPLQQKILDAHRSVINPEQACYIVAGWGTVGGAEPQAAVHSDNTVAELTASLSDTLALRIAAEADLQRERVRSDAAVQEARLKDDELRRAHEKLASLEAELRDSRKLAENAATELRRSAEEKDRLQAELLRNRENLDRSLREKAAIEASAKEQEDRLQAELLRNRENLDRSLREKAAIEASAKEQEDRLQAELLRNRENLDRSLREKAAIEASAKEQEDRLQAELLRNRENLDRSLREKAAIEASAKEQEEQLKRLVGSFSESASRFSEAFDRRLREYRAQRAWKIMLAIRRAYTLVVRGGWSGWWRLVFGPREPLDHYELAFPKPEEYLHPLAVPAPAVVKTPDVIAPPPRKYDVIVLAIIDFDFRFQRPQQIAAQLAREGHRVLWVTATKTIPQDSPAPYQIGKLRENIWEIRLRAPAMDLYLKEFAPGAVACFAEGLRAVYRDFAVSESAILVQLPFWRRLALQLREEHGGVMLYDCMDDWDTFENLGEFNRSEERKLAGECDVLAVTAERLRRKFDTPPLAPVLARNGADFDFFSSAQPLEGLRRDGEPVIGYFGAIADWIDLDLLYEVARSRPQYSFVLAGQVFDRDIRALEALPNVRFLGSRPYEQMPSLLAAFDVCIIPFKLNQVTHATDPVKLYEYLSQGKPVVATAMQELHSVAGLCWLAEGAVEFAQKLDEAVADVDPQRRQARIDFARKNTWASRVAALDSAIRGKFPKISVLVVTYNCAEYIGPALRALFRNEYPNLEVILVDNHSIDDTVLIARRLASSHPQTRIETLASNRCFAGANNVAAGLATGDYLVFLNADTLVTPGWLGRLLRHLQRDPSIGLICPVTNFAGNEVKITVDYRNQQEMERFALSIARARRGELHDVAVVPLYCALMRNSVFKELGGLDERYEIGMFEDDDLSLKVKERGLRVVVAEDCFVHHFGQASFSKLPPDEYNRIFDANRRRFEEKWKRRWIAHRTRAGVRPASEETRFDPGSFCV